ncbi:unnamed protein product, partial [Polarella glacialis]
EQQPLEVLEPVSEEPPFELSRADMFAEATGRAQQVALEPEAVERLQRRWKYLETQVKQLSEHPDEASKARLQELRRDLSGVSSELEPVRARTEQELLAAKQKLQVFALKSAAAEARHDTFAAESLRYESIPRVEQQIWELERRTKEYSENLWEELPSPKPQPSLSASQPSLSGSHKSRRPSWDAELRRSKTVSFMVNQGGSQGTPSPTATESPAASSNSQPQAAEEALARLRMENAGTSVSSEADPSGPVSAAGA